MTTKPPPDPQHLLDLAKRHELALLIENDPGFAISRDDMEAIAFALRFTAEYLRAETPSA